MKLMITDLDGTLFPKKDVENPRQFEDNIEAVKNWIDQGNIFAVATARGIHHCDVLFGKLGFQTNFIGDNGAEVMLETGEIISKTIPCQVFIDLCKFVIENEIDASVATGINNAWLWSSKDCYPLTTEPIFQAMSKDIKVAELDAIDPLMGTTRIQVFTHPNNRDNLKQMIIDRNYGISVTTSDSNLIDVGPLNSSKGISILELCDKFRISKDDLVVVGDSENDIAMFDITQKSYCIDHAEPAVLKKATKVVKSVKEVVELELV